MANSNIFDLPPSPSVVATDLFEKQIGGNGQNQKAPASQLLDYIEAQANAFLQTVVTFANIVNVEGSLKVNNGVTILSPSGSASFAVNKAVIDAGGTVTSATWTNNAATSTISADGGARFANGQVLIGGINGNGIFNGDLISANWKTITSTVLLQSTGSAYFASGLITLDTSGNGNFAGAVASASWHTSNNTAAIVTTGSAYFASGKVTFNTNGSGIFTGDLTAANLRTNTNAAALTATGSAYFASGLISFDTSGNGNFSNTVTAVTGNFTTLVFSSWRTSNNTAAVTTTGSAYFASGAITLDTGGNGNFSGSLASARWNNTNLSAVIASNGSAYFAAGSVAFATNGNGTFAGDVYAGTLWANAAHLTAIPAPQLTGTVAVANLGYGTNASSSTFWRGDGTWASVQSAGTTSLTIVPKSSGPVILYGSDSGKWYTHTGASAEVDFYLVSAQVGQTFSFGVSNTQLLKVLPSPTEKIVINGSVTGNNGYIISNSAGNSIQLVCFRTGWWDTVGVNGANPWTMV